MNVYLLVIILAAAQGVAEFLPISSSGHLLVLGDWFGFDAEDNMTLNVVLHSGTLLAILVFYFRRILSILLEKSRRRLIWLVIIGSVPAAAVGVTLKACKLDKVIFSSPWVAAAGFLITGTMLLTVFGVPWKKPADEPEDAGDSCENMSLKQALLIGCAQAMAITPGISRSGSTITAGVLSKLRKADAAEFSFLLAIPAIGGAAVLELADMLKENSAGAMEQNWALFGCGFIVAAVVGYASLAGLIAMLKKGKLGWFGCYLYVAAIAVAVVQLTELF